MRPYQRGVKWKWRRSGMLRESRRLSESDSKIQWLKPGRRRSSSPCTEKDKETPSCRTPSTFPWWTTSNLSSCRLTSKIRGTAPALISVRQPMAYVSSTARRRNDLYATALFCHAADT
eukprot:11225_4